ncbi:MAG: chitobiase/beta-hexosaminidase C-terminal domain-containing protein [Paludibacteraceae bacterium]|nr:chitobiase/beta-hexosaminidase C-terminal domain-containing protein [Paludibacteraceae bacterium]
MKKLKLFFALFAMLALGVSNAWGAEKTITLTYSDFGLTTSYAQKAATVDGIGFTVNQGYKGSGNVIQMNSTKGAGVLYNTTSIAGLKSITVNVSSGSKTYTITSGTAQTPSGNSQTGTATKTFSIPSGDTYFQLKVSGASYFSSIVITYDDSNSGGETPEPEPDPTPDPGTGTTGTLVITRASFPSGSLTYNTTDNWSATASTGETVSGQGDLYSTSNQTTMQTKNSSVSTHYHNTTAMPGAISKISVEVASGTDRSYTVYASTTAITSTTGLTSLGSLKGATPIEIDPTKDYKYFWLQCTGGASYLNNITITYNIESSGGGEPETPTPSVSVAPTSHTFATTNVGETATQVFEITAKNTTETLSAEISNTTDYAISAIADNKITVTYQPQTAETHEATLTIKAGDEASATVTLSGKAVAVLEGTWALVTDASSLKAGDEIIIAAKDYDVALSTTQNNNNRGEIAITKNGNLITATSEVQVLTLQAGKKENTLALYTGAGYLHAASSGSNHLKTETTLSDNSSWTISIADGTATLTAQGTYTRNTMFYNQSSKIFACYASNTTTQKAIALYKKVDPNAVIEPQFKLAAGEYYGTQSVEITCATAGAEIYYTLNGTDPTSASTKYTGAISIASTTTVKAIAVKGANSSTVVSATYTILAPLATMQEIFDKATAVGGTATPVHITMNNWVITGVKGSNAYLTDGTKGLIIYTASHGFNVGDILSGTVACKVQLYKGSAELTELTATTEGLTITTGGAVSPIEVTDITTLGGVNTGSVIKVTGPCTVNGTKYYVAGLELYNSLFAYTNPEAGFNYECTGVYVQFDATQEILPRKAEDLVKIETQQPAGIVFAVTEHTAEVGATDFEEPELTNPNGLTVTYSTSDATLATVNTNTGAVTIGNKAGKVTITASFAGSEDYVAANASYNITITDPNQLEATFVAGTDKSDTKSISKNGITVEFADGSFSRDDNYRCYAGKSMTISYADGNITKIVIECTANDGAEYGPGQFTTEIATYSYSGKVGTWTGEANSVTFTNIKQVRMTAITVYYKQDNRTDAGLAWNPTAVNLTIGDAFTAPTFSNPYSLAVNFVSDNEALATVNNAGAISLKAGAVGTATITASFAGNETYKDAEVKCTISVSPKTENVVILAQYAGKWYALKAEYVAEKTDRLVALPVEYINGTLYNVADADKALITWERVVIGNKATFKNGDNYLKGKSSTTLIIEGETTGLYQWDYPSYTMVIEGSTTVRTFLYNNTNNCFRNYDSANASDGIDEEKVYSALPVVTAAKFENATIIIRSDLTAGNFGTICYKNNITNFTGATFYEVAGKEGRKVIFDEVTELVAGMPYIFRAEAAELKIVLGQETATTAGQHKSLQGTFEKIEDGEAGEAGNTLEGNYIIYNNFIKKCGAKCGLLENRAYFIADALNNLTAPVSPAPGRKRVSMDVLGENEATGVDNITENGVIAPAMQGTYDVLGRQLSEPTATGFYIVNGKKVFVVK